MNIIVTGASRGIGYELVKLFAAAEGNKVIALSRNAVKLEALARECASFASPVITVPCDITKTEDLLQCCKIIENNINKADVLINNAGAIVNKPFAELGTEDLEYVYKLNVFAVVGLIQKMLPLMNEKERSHIVNIGSMGGFQGSAKFAGLSAYSSSKAALACLTECLAEEFKDRNIAFNCLALGAAQTEMLNEAFPGYKAPLSAKEMATFIAGFSIEAQKYLNGKVVPVSMSNP